MIGSICNFFSRRIFSFKIFCASFFMLLTIVTAHCQEPEPIDFRFPQVSFPTINVRDLGRYGNFGYSLSKGQVLIDVPLYTAESRGVRYPISLSYNHAGIKVNERSGMVGMNWSLVGQGNISRIMNGRPDEDASFGYNIKYDLVVGKGLYTPTGFNDPYYRAAEGFFDLEPDYFVFNFNGRSGSFFFDPRDKKYYSMPYSGLKIKSTGYMDAFEIIDEKGYVYQFNEYTTSSSQSESGTGTGLTNGEYKTQWYLNKIIDPGGNIVMEIQYTDTEIDLETKDTENVTYQLLTTGQCGVRAENLTTTKSRSVNMFSVSAGEKLPKKMIWPDGSLAFQYSPQPNGKRKLDGMELYSGTQLLRNWQFYYSPYAGTNKLRLDSVAVLGTERQVHSFAYNEKEISQYQSNSQDHWGYYNGARNVWSLIPEISYQGKTVGSANRESNFQYCAAGILESVTYPTKGKTAFEYELNDYLLDEPEPIYDNKQVASVSRRYVLEGEGVSSSVTFVVDQLTDVSYSSYRDNSNGGPPNMASPEPCQVVIHIVGEGKRYPISGPRSKTTSGKVTLLPGTYHIELTTYGDLDFGWAIVSMRTITGYKNNGNSGGLRIKRIQNLDTHGTVAMTREFDYTGMLGTDKSSGRALVPKYYSSVIQNGMVCVGGTALPACTGFSNELLLSSFSNVDLFFSDGGPVSYKRVVENITDGEKKHSIEHFFSFDNDVMVTTFPFSGVSSRSWKRGRPILTNYYNGAGKKLRTVENKYYDDFERKRHVLPGVRVGKLMNCPYEVSKTRLSFGYYTLVSEWNYLTNSISKDYTFENDILRDSVVTSTDYFYDNPEHGQATRTILSKSDASQDLNFFSFPGDYTTGTAWVDDLKNKNLIATPIEKVRVIKKGTVQMVGSAQVAVYKPFGTGMIDKVYNLEDIGQLAVAQFKFSSRTIGQVPPAGTVAGFGIDSRYKAKFQAVLYDSYGNLRESKKSEEPSTVYLWGYNGQYPVMEIKNVTYLEVEKLLTKSAIDNLNLLTQTEATMETLIKNAADKLRTGLPNAMVSSYTYKPLVGLTSKTDARGIKETYKYDGMQRLQAILDQVGNVTKAIDYHYRPN